MNNLAADDTVVG